MPDEIRRLDSDRFREFKYGRNDARTPTLTSPGRKNSVAELRRREIDEELVATLGRKP